jgi:hypothetical protein
MEYTFKIINPIANINLPFPISCRSVKIQSISYTTASIGNKMLIVRMNGFNNHVYYDGNITMKCLNVFPLSSTNGTDNIISYELNNNISLDVREIKLNTLNLEFLIDGVMNNDISPTNPIIIKMLFY